MNETETQGAVIDPAAENKPSKSPRKPKAQDAAPASILATLQDEAIALARSGDVHGESVLSVTIGKLYDLKKHLAGVEHEALADIKAILE